MDIDYDMPEASLLGMSLYHDGSFDGVYSDAVVGGENSKLKTCNNMGFESIKEYIDAFDKYVDIGSAHRSIMFQDDNKNMPNYLIEWKYFRGIRSIYINSEYYSIDDLLGSSNYDNYLEFIDPRGCMFLIRPRKDTLARIYDSSTYNRLSWVCEDWKG